MIRSTPSLRETDTKARRLQQYVDVQKQIHSGAEFVEDTDSVELGDGLEEKILNPEDSQAW